MEIHSNTVSSLVLMHFIRVGSVSYFVLMTHIRQDHEHDHDRDFYRKQQKQKEEIK